jgi:molybdopterin/thiamine biosynthesis adenylyltransferase
MESIASFGVTVCGAGALGGNVTESLARSGYRKLRLVDRDRVEERNLSTQPYYRSDVGAPKARVLAGALYRAVGVEVEAQVAELGDRNAGKLLTGSDLVLDTFDNSTSRRAVSEACRAAAIPCLHIGLAADYAEVIWDEEYRVPSARQDDVCDYPLARNLVTLAVAVGCEVATGFVRDASRRSYTITLGDLKIEPYSS